RRPDNAEARIATETSAKVSRSLGEGPLTDAGRRVKQAIEAACNALIAAEEELTEMDRAAGDGDLGASMKRAAMAVQSGMDSYPLNNLSPTFKAIGHVLQREMGGSSGPLYGVFFLRCGNVLESSRTSGLAQWVEAVDQGCQAICELGGAKPGDRTMLDALAPYAKSLKSARGEPSREILLIAVRAAEDGADATAQMKPRLGRSSYLGDRVLGHPDPGAKAVAIWLRAASEALFLL
ncbi:MAG: dihydroxyacetone kinase subunit DhaL, partial [Candidatus Sulfotelmatobacter sp.]